MALLWSKTVKDCTYEVRSAGNSIRLYSNGIFHSQWNPNKAIAGHLWDLLALPVLLLDAELKKTALVLGVGGGAAINLLNDIAILDSIDGVDLDPVHLSIAKRFFKCRANNIKLFETEAQQYLHSCDKQYDLIIDDLFAGTESDKSDARRAVEFNTQWFSALSEKLSNNGVLVVNFEDVTQFKRGLRTIGKEYFSARFSFNSNRYENVIGVFTRQDIGLSDFRARIKSDLDKQALAVINNSFQFKRV